MKFLAIFSDNLDEFFEVRVAGLIEQLSAGLRTTTPDGLDLVDQLRAIRTRADELVARQAAVFAKEIAPALEDEGIRFVDWDDLAGDDRAYLDDDVRRARSSRCSRRSRSTPRTRSPTSRTCR